MADIDDFADEISDILSLNPEENEGNCEYKRSLLGKNKRRLEELARQMCFRLSEGKGECRYCIGIDDDGSFYGLTEEEHQETIDTLKSIAKDNDCSIRNLQTVTKDDRKASEFLIRENNITQYKEIRIAVAGSANSGKSSCIGVLISGQKDNGKGGARGRVLNFKHEQITGATSSIAQQILGYDPEGQVVNYDSDIRDITWKEIVKKSSKIISFFDLCGQPEYIKTTISGVSSAMLDYGIVTVGANMGITDNTIEHIRLLRMHRIPIIIFLTKIDLCEDKPKILKNTIDAITKLFKQPGNRKSVSIMKDVDDVLNDIDNVKLGTVIPLFKLSNTNLSGHDLIHYFFNLLDRRIVFDSDSPIELHIDNTFSVRGIGTVVGGMLKKGTIKTGNTYYMGPYRDRSYREVKVRTMEVKRTLVDEFKSGAYVCVSLPKVSRLEVERGMVLLEKPCKAISEFEAEIIIFNAIKVKGQKSIPTIRVGYETTMTVNSLRTPIKLIKIVDKKQVSLKKSSEQIHLDNLEGVLYPCDRATVHFKCSLRPCYFNIGDRFSMAESNIKATGIIKEIL